MFPGIGTSQFNREGKITSLRDEVISDLLEVKINNLNFTIAQSIKTPVSVPENQSI